MENKGCEKSKPSVTLELRSLKYVKGICSSLSQPGPVVLGVDKQVKKKTASIHTTPSNKTSVKSSPAEPVKRGNENLTFYERHSEELKQKIFCYTCECTVTGKDIVTHLYFGNLKCKDCHDAIFTNCKSFLAKYDKTGICKKTDKPHNFSVWKENPVVYLEHNVRKQLAINKYCSKTGNCSLDIDRRTLIKNYVKSLLFLKALIPWGHALRQFQNLIDEQREVVTLPFENVGVPFKQKESSCSKDNCFKVGEQCGKGITPGKFTQVLENNSRGEGNTKKVNGFYSFQRKWKEPLSKNTEALLQAKLNGSSEPIRLKKVKQMKGHNTVVSSKVLGKKFLAEIAQNKNTALKYKHVKKSLESTKHSSNIEKGVTKTNVPISKKEDACLDNIKGPTVNMSVEKKIPETSEKIKINKRTLKKKCERTAKRLKTSHGVVCLSPDKFKPPKKFKNDRYLVMNCQSDEWPDECPNCYSALHLSMVTVNCTTSLVDIVCRSCSLTIYILMDSKFRHILKKNCRPLTIGPS
ncbi:uncharacterized protein LOC121869080 [Homarus americanus]|uniref:uncharacterized protein LOC121869080 n=1 Tax=Homarus americanus TaxID=6706 RepID=UPI001C46CB8B|nr:uncharacterized protein LOC121869080 [Homarus americanus]